MRIRTIFENWDKLENAIYRSLSGVIGKRHKSTNMYVSFIISKCIMGLIKDKHLIGIGNYMNISFDLKVNDGKVLGVDNLKYMEYAPVSIKPSELGSFKINTKLIENMIIMEEKEKGDDENNG